MCEIEEQRETLSELARERLLSLRHEPLFLADWERVLMIHYEVDPGLLRRIVPFPLDLWDGRAFVSAVAFTMRRMRPRWGGPLANWVFQPLSTHRFLNLRTYVVRDGEPGIYFLAEWLSNRLSVALGPRMFGLPYRFGRLDYQHEHERSTISGTVRDSSGRRSFAYHACLDSAEPCPCEAGSPDEWLMERYTAFTHVCGKSRFFRVWHPPWPQIKARVAVTGQSLLEADWDLFRTARVIGGNYSPGVHAWMGWPHYVKRRVQNINPPSFPGIKSGRFASETHLGSAKSLFQCLSGHGRGVSFRGRFSAPRGDR